MTNEETRELEASIDEMMVKARDFGLDFYEMRFEVCPADIIYTFGSYGMPTRFSHWSFGKAFHRMKMQYDFGLSRIYELVINSDPCYAFLLDGNTLIQNKMVSAHVLAHCDFFKNNSRFAQTSRYMVESMATSADRIRQYEVEYGKKTVEEFLDAILGVQEHIDPSIVGRKKLQVKPSVEQAHQHLGSEYDDLWSLEKQPAKADENTDILKGYKKIPERPEKDLLLFLMNHSKVLADWQCDVLSIMRDEMLYFWPQIETKIMNEGWATYWHLRIMREMPMTDGETIDFARMHSGVVMPSRTNINPYHVGLVMWEDIEKRLGREAMFEIREVDSDSSFLRNYLTQELVEEMDLYLYQKVGNEWKIVEKDWEKVRDQMCTLRVNGGFPVLLVHDGDYLHNGELYLKHEYEGVELDIKYLEKTIPYVHQLWGRTTHLETVLEGRPALFTYDGKKCHRRFL